MPSTASRKPWTKCWRDCSPSPTMSMPASSCSLIASSVASSLAVASSSPSSRHGAHSLFGTASQAGFGRLPAIVVGNSGSVAGIVRAQLSRQGRGRPPVVEPIVMAQQPPAAHRAHRGIAQHSGQAAQVIALAVACREPLHLASPRRAAARNRFATRRRHRPACARGSAPRRPHPRSPWRRLGRGTAASDGRRPRAAPRRLATSSIAAGDRRAPISARLRAREPAPAPAAPSARPETAATDRSRLAGSLQPGAFQLSVVMTTMLISSPALTG